MPRLAGAAAVSLVLLLTVASHGLRLKLNPLPVPIYLVLTIVFITSGSIIVSYIASKAYLMQRLPSMLLLGSGALIFGLTSLVAALAALMAGLEGSNAGTTIFIVGALLSSALQLSSVGLRPIGTRGGRGSGSAVVLALAAVLFLVSSVSVAAFEGALPTFLIPGRGTTPLANVLLAVEIAAFGLAALKVALPRLTSGVLYWYSCALAMTAVGLLGILLSGWSFETTDFLIGRAALCLAGAFMVLSVQAAERPDRLDPDSVLKELFVPISAHETAARGKPGTKSDGLV